jgi:hypothetical protein
MQSLPLHSAKEEHRFKAPLYREQFWRQDIAGTLEGSKQD